MKKRLGIVSILLTFILTYVLWLFVQPEGQISIYRQYSQLIASIALVAFTWINFISSRHRSVDEIFHGLDKSYIYHKYLSILAIILIWVHNFTLKMGRFSGGRPSAMAGQFRNFNTEGIPQGAGSGLLGIDISGKDFGSLSLYIFTALVIFFLITYKLEYERWKLLHKLMLVPYVFGIVHYYLDSDYSPFSITGYNLWMHLINAIGIITALYSIFLYESTAFKYKYKVTNIREVAKNTLEITGTTNGKEMQYRPGQFSFIKVLGKKGFPSHPFTICQAHKAGEIQFAIKALGDHTGKLKDTIVLGDTIAAAGPHGKFNFRSGGKHQVWVAGGIGITPFRSFWQAEIPGDYTIDFFYAYNNEVDAPYVDELKALKPKSNLRIHLFDSSKTGFLGIEHYEKYLNKNETFDVFFCGPQGMRKKLKEDLKKGLFKIREFHYEHFKFK
ncbi:MAG: ferric reductase-like transmembrane domain-containing protein [Bacillota bacterium]|nr:ferric reductase-like transmembrane domain-containing protein [Bacillota bacterium]